MYNIYEIRFAHYAPKGSHEGICLYLAAKSDEEVYEWLKDKGFEYSIYVSYQDEEFDEQTYEVYDDDFNLVEEETPKEHYVRFKGELYDPDAEVSDAYYGATHYGWKLKKENVSIDIIQVMFNNGIEIVVAGD